METLEERFKNGHLLTREERRKLHQEIALQRPDFVKKFVPRWWWWRRCPVNVLIVADGLNFDTSGFGLSEFLTTFNQLEATSWIDYKVTLAHRSGIIPSPNPVVVNHISNFKFDTSVTLTDFDQVWLFGIDSFTAISTTENNAIEAYMNGGGGLFATGDHGSLGSAMCANIPRVKDMRIWNDFPNSIDDTNEVSMGGRRRNDTNAPRPGDTIADTFDHQSDAFPQTIGVKLFGTGYLPHPLLSISTTIRPSGIIDIMPDHPHEGECKPETSFTIAGQTIPTQIIATSFVKGGNTSGGKDRTDPHCFPSIAVWDGRAANAGRIVIDSTWHHFVNINLNGVDSSQSGLTNADFDVVQRYFMNIATWMSRRRPWICWWRWIIFDLFTNSQLIEASLNNPAQKIKDIKLADLSSIGALAEEILASKYNPSFGRSFLVDMMYEYNPAFAKELDIWAPKSEKDKANRNGFYNDWINVDQILWSAIGSAFISLRDNTKLASIDSTEKELEIISTVFTKGMDYGYNAALESLAGSSKKMFEILKPKQK